MAAVAVAKSEREKAARDNIILAACFEEEENVKYSSDRSIEFFFLNHKGNK
jgi:hypothetical protein